MTRQIICRLIAVAIIALIIGSRLHYDHQRYFHMGKDAFLQLESARYARSYTESQSVVVPFIAALGLTMIMFAIYEAIAYAFCRLAKVMEGNPPDNRNKPQAG